MPLQAAAWSPFLLTAITAPKNVGYHLTILAKAVAAAAAGVLPFLISSTAKKLNSKKTRHITRKSL